jgi:hypothetical protein
MGIGADESDKGFVDGESVSELVVLEMDMIDGALGLC